MMFREDDPFKDKFQNFRQSSGEGNEASTSFLNKAIDGSGISDRYFAMILFSSFLVSNFVLFFLLLL